MPSTTERLTALINDNFDLDKEPNFDATFSDSGISSIDAIAFFKLVDDEFGLGLKANDCRQFQTLQEVADFINERSS